MNSTSEPAEPAPSADGARVLVVDADRTTLELIEEWLAADGRRVVSDAAPAGEPIDLAIVDIPYPRNGGVERLRQLSDTHPGVPILVMSATFFAGVACSGGCASALGAAGVLPKPITREALIGAVRRLSRRA
jgi:CheY-like chemotaxis protein